MERLIVKNFGPLKSVDIEIKNINVFIGPTGSGKSTLAKLLAVLTDRNFKLDNDYSKFRKLLSKFRINTYLSSETYIEYRYDTDLWIFESNNITTNYALSGFKLRKFQQLKFYRKTPASRIVGIIDDLAKINLKRLKNDEISSKISRTIRQLKAITKGVEPDEIISLESLMNIRELNEIENYLTEVIVALRSEFVPAERLFYSTFSNALFSLYTQEINVPEFIGEFANNLETAQFMNEMLDVEELGLSFNFSQGNLLYSQGGKQFRIDETASGIQSIMPIAYAVASFKEGTDSHLFIEEPELNLFPKAQYALTKHIVKDWDLNKKLIITTHSPYILSALDNLISAGNIGKGNPSKTEKVVAKNYWLEYNNVNAYYFNPEPKRGKDNTENIMNADRKGISGNVIDEVSDILNIEYEKLQEIGSNG